jgi:hypothetical protein
MVGQGSLGRALLHEQYRFCSPVLVGPGRLWPFACPERLHAIMLSEPCGPVFLQMDELRLAVG